MDIKNNINNDERAEILCAGTELLLGDIVNTNAAFLSRELASLGFGVYHHSVVGDNPERLKSALELALSRADLVIMSGGLGPTKDDLTKEEVRLTMEYTSDLQRHLDIRYSTMYLSLIDKLYVCDLSATDRTEAPAKCTSYEIPRGMRRMFFMEAYDK